MFRKKKVSFFENRNREKNLPVIINPMPFFPHFDFLTTHTHRVCDALDIIWKKNRRLELRVVFQYVNNFGGFVPLQLLK